MNPTDKTAMNTSTPSQPIAPELAAVLARLEKCAAYDGVTLTEILEDVGDDLEAHQ